VTTTADDIEDFAGLDPFFQIIREGLAGTVPPISGGVVVGASDAQDDLGNS